MINTQLFYDKVEKYAKLENSIFYANSFNKLQNKLIHKTK